VLRIARNHAAHTGITYAQALDEALCVGWIDGVRRSLDGDSYSIRFTPRQPRSIWSNVNLRHAERLIGERRMTAAGLAAFQARDPARTGIYSFERQTAELSPAHGRRFRAVKPAWAWFQQQAPWYRRTATHWVTSAKREETRRRRLEALIACSARGELIGPLRRTPASRT
jgi:uncharacterized protein YdeI (YjbR/CyaY-like superfamily)